MYAMHLPMDRIIKVDDFFTSFILFLVTRVWSVMKEHPSGHPGLLSSSELIWSVVASLTQDSRAQWIDPLPPVPCGRCITALSLSQTLSPSRARDILRLSTATEWALVKEYISIDSFFFFFSPPLVLTVWTIY